MSTEERIIHYMTNYEPEQGEFKEGAVYYTDTLKTHQSYAAQLMSAPRTSIAYRLYLNRSLEWLKLLKKHGINLQNVIKK
jgi:hypothetical protein